MEEEIGVPKKKSIFLLVFLSIITIGIYPLIWYIKRVDEFNNLRTKSKFGKNLPEIILLMAIAIIALYLVMFFFAVINSGSMRINDINEVPLVFIVNFAIIVLLSVIFIIMNLSVTFKARKILNEVIVNKGTKAKVSWFFTLIFNFLYIQYEINRIIDDKEENKKLGPTVSLIGLILIFLISMVIFSSIG